MTDRYAALNETLAGWPRAPLALLPTPIHRIENFSRELGGPELWIKRDDLTGLEGGGNKTRKLEYLVGDALASGADMLVTDRSDPVEPHPPDRRGRGAGTTSSARCCTSAGPRTPGRCTGGPETSCSAA